MLMTKWLVVARNEYRIGTSSFRAIRPYFPYVAVGMLAVYVAFLAPAFVSLFIDEVSALFLSQAAAAMVQIFFFMFFIFFLTFPISLALKEVKAEEQEIFLSAPIQASDILLGKFLGQIPFYAIGITLIMGLITAVLKPLGLDFLQMTLAILISVASFLSALWIGIVTTAILRTKLGRTSRGKDIGRALSLIIVLPVVALIYAVASGSFLKALANPATSRKVKIMLGWLPSSWGAEVITGFTSNPGNISAIWLETLVWSAAVILFFIAVLWLGTKWAGHAYSLEPTTFTSSRVKPEGPLYRTVKRIGGGGAFGAILVSIFKDYSRRFQNLSRIVYVIGILVLINIFFGETENPRQALLMAQFMLPVLAAFVVGEVTLRGKENLFIFRKAPSGEAKVIKARLIQGWLIVIPISALMAVGTLMKIPQTPVLSLLEYAGLIMVVAAANVAFALGLFLLMPAFTEKSGEFAINIVILSLSSLLLFLASREILSQLHIKGLFYTQLLHILLSWIVGLVFFYLGKKHLSQLE